MKQTKENLTIAKGLLLKIEGRKTRNGLTIKLVLNSRQACLLHWGLCRYPGAAWELPAAAERPAGSWTSGGNALQTPFTPGKTESRITIKLGTGDFSELAFVLFFPAENLWDNNRGANYSIRLPRSEESMLTPSEALNAETMKGELTFQKAYALPGGRQLAAELSKTDGHVCLRLVSDMPGPLILHWGVAQKTRYEWLPPPPAILPAAATVVDAKAAQLPFAPAKGFNRLQLEMPEAGAPLGLTFVLYQPETGQWLKPDHGNFFIPVRGRNTEETVFATADLHEIADEIIHLETGRNSWTLMHRFNLCHDLLDRAGGGPHLWALLFVWLRYSAIRQLDWQRNYNTKPRELSHAQKRLTVKLAAIYRANDAAGRELIRLILSTVGRGGEGGKGQMIRDGILHIMHRHNIKEFTGHFMEEWHQKLHNNATPDDIVICEAYLAFLRSNGDHGAFYETLAAGGVTRERLEGFERPIVTAPDFAPHLKDGLIYDFENYLKLLKSVHSATDLFSALEDAGGCLDDGLRGRAWSIYHGREDRNIKLVDRVSAITDVRRSLMNLLDTNPDDRCVRDILYLDLALDEFQRVEVERQTHHDSNEEQLAVLIGLLLENLGLTHHDDRLAACLPHWRRLLETKHFDRHWALHARSVLDRITEALGGFIDYYYEMLQPKAEYLGHGFQAEAWTIELFNQEVVRGSPAYVLSLLLRRIEPVLRKTARLGSWQIISRSEADGRVEVTDLYAVQDKRYKRPTVIITDNVKGEEEIPEGVTAVITPAGVDILSHVAVRSRNAGILFATCYEPAIIDQLKAAAGRNLRFTPLASGDVEFGGVGAGTGPGTRKEKNKRPGVSGPPPVFTAYALSSADFNDRVVGGKSLHLLQLRDRLPDWIGLPRSAAVPFCVCERVLNMKENETILPDYNRLLQGLKSDPVEVLPKLRKKLMTLTAPGELNIVLRRVMDDEGFTARPDWEDVWTRIKHVWASKWNELAYWSREKWGIGHDTLFMAVLIQEVVDADYAFVLHTVNPFTGDNKEIYGEVVLGLGETLCSGGYPGRALSFTCRKGGTLSPKIISYPGKSLALKGGGLIFRSDSNGEDLGDYAGAGLYDSVMLEPPREIIPDYVSSPLLWEEEFRKNFLRRIASIGIEIENIMAGVPQDIEGAYADGRFYIVQTRPQV